jgi:hypothetical protein
MYARRNALVLSNLMGVTHLQAESTSTLSFLKIAAFCFLSTATAASATEICKSVDEEGNVSFTDCQAADSDSTHIEMKDVPTEEEILQAKERAKQQIDAFDEIIGTSDSPATPSDTPAGSPSESAPQMPASVTRTRWSREQDEARQIALDEQCQIAREKILSVERAQYVEECVQGRSRRTREECEHFYADHGAATATRGPLYLDLPECVEAYEFRRDLNR